jgi:hypothetical protein
MAGRPRAATIGYPQSPTLGGQQMLEWRPRLIFLLLVIVVFALAAGYSVTDIGFDNWEW